MLHLLVNKCKCRYFKVKEQIQTFSCPQKQYKTIIHFSIYEIISNLTN
jgi:hypothetical protein